MEQRPKMGLDYRKHAYRMGDSVALRLTLSNDQGRGQTPQRWR